MSTKGQSRDRVTGKKLKHRMIVTAENAFLVKRIDVFATEILKQAFNPTKPGSKDPPLPLEMQLNILDKLAKWVSVRNKLADAGEQLEGGALDGIRNQLKSNAAGRTLPRLGERPGDFVTHRYGRRPQDLNDSDGAGLADLKSRLPRADAGGDDNDSDDAGGEDDPVSSDSGGVHADLSGDQSGDDDGADRGRDV